MALNSALNRKQLGSRAGQRATGTPAASFARSVMRPQQLQAPSQQPLRAQAIISPAQDVNTNGAHRATPKQQMQAAPAMRPADFGCASDQSEFEQFCSHAASGANIIPLYQRIFSDQLTPVLAYRCLVSENDVDAPSFLLESVVNGNQQGRYSFVGAQPALEIISKGHDVTVLNHAEGTRSVKTEADPMEVPVSISRNWRPAQVEGLPAVFTGGFVGYAGYDTVRYVYGGKIPFSAAPKDDRNLADMHLSLYNDVVVFDQATKLIYVISWVHLDEATTTGRGSVDGEQPVRTPEDLRAAYEQGKQRLQHTVQLLSSPPPSLAPAQVDMSLSKLPAPPGTSNMTKQEFLDAVMAAKEYILSGDIFQLVLSQRYERRTFANPFEVYRALRVVNPSPYMVYMQARGCIIVSSSPEILCRVDNNRVVTNRPLAGTRRRGTTPEDDVATEKELLADQKEVAEHVMLVDLGRNDVGKVSNSGSVVVEKLMEVERYSHVMHISSTVTGQLQPGLDSWDALRAALPAGTVSGAPKVRAMQIIDELEVNKRGPYGGGLGHVAFNGSMDMALGLRTMVVPTAGEDSLYSYNGTDSRKEWTIHLQAGAGLVADSVPESEYEETLNKAAALGRAIDLAEEAFVRERC